MAETNLIPVAQAGQRAEYLTCTLNGEQYALQVLRVTEIRGWEPVTRVPNAPEYMKGVVNLRGAIVPIIDPRIQLQLGEAHYTSTTVVIVVLVAGANGVRVMGLVVDAVSDVFQVSSEEIQPTPALGAQINTEFISGLAAVKGEMVMLLDVDCLLNVAELSDAPKGEETADQDAH